MAFNSTLPPQAYTREILAAAYTWLQKQPESIRKLATSPDSLAGLYLRAQRYGAVSPEAEAPVSSQNFMAELKTLATDLRQFEKPVEPSMTFDAPNSSMHAAPSTSSPTTIFNSQGLPPAHLSQPAHSAASVSPTMNSHPLPPAPAPASFVAPPPMTQPKVFAPATPPISTPLAQPTPPPSAGLSMRSREMIAEIKESFNLSSDSEALNLAVGVAYKNLKSLLS